MCPGSMPSCCAALSRMRCGGDANHGAGCMWVPQRLMHVDIRQVMQSLRDDSMTEGWAVCSWWAKCERILQAVARGARCAHLVGLMQQQPVYVCHSQICICERRLHHLCRPMIECVPRRGCCKTEYPTRLTATPPGSIKGSRNPLLSTEKARWS